jgi:uncharacterized protein YbjT (DUF2867 family)
MRVVIFGATGMVGAGALLEGIDDPRVTSIVAIVRRPTGVHDAKLTEIVHDDFYRYDTIANQLSGFDACFFCLGVSVAGMTEQAYRRITYDVTIAAAQALIAASPRMTFCFISGGGADSTERGWAMWARVKGQTENALLKMPFGAVYVLRPGYIQPRRGVRSRTPIYEKLYSVMGPAYPVLHWLLPKYTTTTVEIGRALVELAVSGSTKQILENDDINRIAARGGRTGN